MDPSDQTIAPKPEQQNTKEFAAKIALKTSLPDTETIPTTLVSGSQQVGTPRILPEILYQIIDCLDWSDELPTIICVSLTAKVCYDYLAFLRRQGGVGGWYKMASRSVIGACTSIKELGWRRLKSCRSEYRRGPIISGNTKRFVPLPCGLRRYMRGRRHMDYHNMNMPFKYNFVTHAPYFHLHSATKSTGTKTWHTS
ncbi:uncharacterized protein EAE97_008036 [Botrytis byssoidea]|uniref:Uncharacterized protein n=1 Tax=Botrytis byssoidea TaxID=139641 RepID=A0A9P5M256_9HELO|nr:uncharacterized protein EAE97_008036 [Botrytis byssoidea]KAF7936670.1 hypothetical protein EAE97_008036 [Botrytis byssoidea]